MSTKLLGWPLCCMVATQAIIVKKTDIIDYSRIIYITKTCVGGVGVGVYVLVCVRACVGDL